MSEKSPLKVTFGDKGCCTPITDYDKLFFISAEHNLHLSNQTGAGCGVSNLGFPAHGSFAHTVLMQSGGGVFPSEVLLQGVMWLSFRLQVNEKFLSQHGEIRAKHER